MAESPPLVININIKVTFLNFELYLNPGSSVTLPLNYRREDQSHTELYVEVKSASAGDGGGVSNNYDTFYKDSEKIHYFGDSN